MTKQEVSKWKCSWRLVPYADGKQPFLPMINLGRKIKIGEIGDKDFKPSTSPTG